MVEQTNREIEIMYRLDHPHIIKLYSHFEDDEDYLYSFKFYIENYEKIIDKKKKEERKKKN